MEKEGGTVSKRMERSIIRNFKLRTKNSKSLLTKLEKIHDEFL
jgi:hypothetical protein